MLISRNCGNVCQATLLGDFMVVRGWKSVLSIYFLLDIWNFAANWKLIWALTYSSWPKIIMTQNRYKTFVLSAELSVFGNDMNNYHSITLIVWFFLTQRWVVKFRPRNYTSECILIKKCEIKTANFKKLFLGKAVNNFWSFTWSSVKSNTWTLGPSIKLPVHEGTQR